MAIRTIVKLGDEILTKRSKEVELNEKTFQILDDLIDTLKCSNGLGLAAPQVGILKRLAVIMLDNDEPLELINPKIIATKGKIIAAEGCLSVPGRYAEVERPQTVIVQTQLRKGGTKRISLHEMQARAACHEIDHLNGELFVDKAIRFIEVED